MLEETKTNLGYMGIDEITAQDNLVKLLTRADKAGRLFRGQYVDLESRDGKEYLGKIVKGPFYIPESGTSMSLMHTKSTVEGDILTQIPPYYVLCCIEIIGEKTPEGIKVAYHRPLPKTPINPTTVEDLMKIIGIKGDIDIGVLYGYSDIPIKLDSQDKNILPRNLVLCGTVGSGKSNTAQVLMEEASKDGYAVIVVDIEGEYTWMDRPNSEERTIEILKKYRYSPEGIKDLRVYYPNGSRKPEGAKNPIPFIVKESSLDLRLLLNFLPELSAKMKSMIADTIDYFKNKQGPEFEYTFDQILAYIKGMDKTGKSATVQAILWRLRSVMRYGIFQQYYKERKEGELDILTGKTVVKKKELIKEIPIEDLLTPGRVSVIDVSDAISEVVTNIVIASLLDRIFKYKVDNDDQRNVLLLIEEAHTFFSSGEMEATLDKIRTIARRGRKRHFCLGFITQQPAHLPAEVFELCNTRIVHQIQSLDNIQVIKETTGGSVRDEVWNLVLGLERGQALVISPQFNHTVITNIRPAKSERKFTD